MSNALKIVLGAVGVIVAVILITYIMNLVNTGKDTFNKGTDGLASSLSQLDSSQYAAYDGGVSTGTLIKQLINQTFSDGNIEILVCTADGYNLVYNTNGYAIFGAATTATNASSDGSSLTYDDATGCSARYLVFAQNATQLLSNLPQYDAKGKPFEAQTGQNTTAVVHKAPSSVAEATSLFGSGDGYTYLELATGYNSAAKMLNPGYISDSAHFNSSIQKDINGDVRRITFVQR